LDMPVAGAVLLRRLAAAEAGQTVSISHAMATEPVSIALHAGLKLRGEPRPHLEPRFEDDALPAPFKGVDLPEVRAQEGRVSAFQVSAPRAVRCTISQLSLRHHGGGCEHDDPADSWGLPPGDAVPAVQAKEVKERTAGEPAAEGPGAAPRGPGPAAAPGSRDASESDTCVDPHKQGQQDKTALNDVAGAACCVGVDSGVLLIEACTVCATNGTALGATGSEARIIIDQCHLKDSAFGVACVLGARVSCSRSLLSSLEQAAVIAVGNGSLCELESNSVSQHARGAYGMSVTEGAKAILEGNSFSRARDAGLSISGLSPHSPLPRP
jgi:hypothetical protein